MQKTLKKFEVNWGLDPFMRRTLLTKIFDSCCRAQNHATPGKCHNNAESSLSFTSPLLTTYDDLPIDRIYIHPTMPLQPL